MCGIVAATGDHCARVDAVLAGLRHRGPDSIGGRSGEGFALAMARLAIMDPEPRADQPMEFGPTVLVYNGEVYNFRELRRDLEARGHRFVTTGDTEVVLHAIAEWGIERACSRLAGMFALAVWDDRTRSLHLARDAFGMKPLYWLGGGKGLVAASEATPLAAVYGLGPRVDAIREFLRFGSPVASVAYEGIAELEPGTVLTWHDDSVRVRPFEAPSSGAHDPAGAVQAGIARHLPSDRPMALFLSGGFDSALLAAATEGSPITAVTLATRDNAEDVRLAEETARNYGIAHDVASVDDADVPRLVDGFLEAMDQPAVDGFNTFLISRIAIDRGFPVALSGLGGDETLGGYGYSTKWRYVEPARRTWSRLPQALRAPVAAALARPARQPARRVAAILGAASVADVWATWRALFADDEIRQLTGAPPPWSPRWLTDAEASPVAQFRQLDFSVYLRATLLRDTDVFSMANSLEVRVPLLDADYVESTRRARWTKTDVAHRIGDELLLRRARAPKLPFGLPWNRWLPRITATADEVLRPDGAVAAVVDVPVARRMLARDDPSAPTSGLRRWALLVLSRWLARDPSARRPLPRPV